MMMRRGEKQDRCDQCGRFVPQCSLVVEDADSDNQRCICQECDFGNARARQLSFVVDGEMVPVLVDGEVEP
jgi:hypothetical protein